MEFFLAFEIWEEQENMTHEKNTRQQKIHQKQTIKFAHEKLARSLSRSTKSCDMHTFFPLYYFPLQSHYNWYLILCVCVCFSSLLAAPLLLVGDFNVFSFKSRTTIPFSSPCVASYGRIGLMAVEIQKKGVNKNKKWIDGMLRRSEHKNNRCEKKV